VATTAPAEPVIEAPAEPVIEAPAPPPPVVSAPELDAARFGFDSDALGPSARAALDQAARLMREQPDLHVTIEGHCDERGTAEYNQALGERRASAAREYLMSAGIASERIQIVSYGEERPLAEGHDEAAWASNRRAQVVVRLGMMGGAVNPDDSK
jgi:peptidoglycan-associated lipoprotein